MRGRRAGVARRLAATEAMRPYVQEELKPGPAATTDDDLLAFARQSGATIFHPGHLQDGQ